MLPDPETSSLLVFAFGAGIGLTIYGAAGLMFRWR